MNKYKVGDKIILTVTGADEMGCLTVYVLNDNFYLWKRSIDDYAEPLSTYTEPLEAKIRRQAAEITRLLRENKELKEDFEKSKIINLNAGRLAGQNEAWELARKIASTAGGLSSSELVEIFNAFLPRDILSENTYPEAAAKVEAWEKAKEEIKVGDVLEDVASSNVKCVVTNMYPGNMAYLVFSDGSAGMYELENMTKTGHHIDIDSFLKQIGGEE